MVDGAVAVLRYRSLIDIAVRGQRPGLLECWHLDCYRRDGADGRWALVASDLDRRLLTAGRALRPRVGQGRRSVSSDSATYPWTGSNPRSPYRARARTLSASSSRRASQIAWFARVSSGSAASTSSR